MKEQNTKTLTSSSLLDNTVRTWFAIAVVGQWIFVLYLITHYFVRAYSQGLEAVNNANLSMDNGYVIGDTLGNVAFILHIIISVITFVCGPLQFIPAIRKRFPKFHRINGRIYIFTGVVTSIAGFYLIWGRGTIGDLSQHISTTLNGILIIIFGVQAFRYAVKRKISIHRKWALRLFITFLGVWFIRIGLMEWVLLTGGIGINWDTFSGPFMTINHFGSYLIPLLFLEAYFFAQKSNNPMVKNTVAVFISIGIVLTAIGIYAAATKLWLPKIL